MRLKSTLPDLTRCWNVKPCSGRRANVGCSVRLTTCNAGYAQRRLGPKSPRQARRLGLKAVWALLPLRLQQRNGATIFVYTLRAPQKSCCNSMTMSCARHGKPTNAGWQLLSRPCTNRHQQLALHSAEPQSGVVRRRQQLEQLEQLGDRNRSQTLLRFLGLAAVAREAAAVAL